MYSFFASHLYILLSDARAFSCLCLSVCCACIYCNARKKKKEQETNKKKKRVSNTDLRVSTVDYELQIWRSESKKIVLKP